MDNYSKGQMIAIGIAFLILPIASVGARLWAKRLGRKGISLDDYLVIAALVCSPIEPIYLWRYLPSLGSLNSLLCHAARRCD